MQVNLAFFIIHNLCMWGVWVWVHVGAVAHTWKSEVTFGELFLFFRPVEVPLISAMPCTPGKLA